MKKILLICSAGISTSLLVKAINNYIIKENLSYKVNTLSVQKAKQKIKKFDILLLSPQIGYMLDEFTKLSKNQKVIVIPLNIYASVKAEAVIELIEKL